MRSIRLLVLSAVLLPGVEGQAHHSIAAVYDGSQQVTVEGVVTEFAFINPHPYVTISVRNGAESAEWRLEMDNRFELTDIGMDASTLKAGDRVIVSGSPGRTQQRAMYLRRLDRPADGFWYEQVGMRPRLGKGNAG